MLPPDYLKKKNFPAWFIRQSQLYSDFSHHIYSDEAYFNLNGCINKQNCRHCTTENPEIIKPNPRPFGESDKLVFNNFARICWTLFFEDFTGKIVTVTSELYTQILREYFSPITEEKGMGSYHFQQDGATSHTAR